MYAGSRNSKSELQHRDPAPLTRREQACDTHLLGSTVTLYDLNKPAGAPLFSPLIAFFSLILVRHQKNH